MKGAGMMVMRILILLAAAVLLTGCTAPDILPTETCIQIATPTDPVALEYRARYIRTDGYRDGARFPQVVIIENRQQLEDYYAANKAVCDLERKEEIYSDTTEGFLDACDAYDDAYFENQLLMFVLLEEGSGSVRHDVQGVEQTADKKLGVFIGREVPAFGTCDMAQWHIILELNRKVMVETPEDVRVYLDGNLAWDGKVIEPVQLPKFTTPPDGVLITPLGEYPLQMGGFNWEAKQEDGTSQAVIADQGSRPLPKDSLKPVTIDGEYAETVFAYVPESGVYEPTNALGFLVKLHWEEEPAQVKITCWDAEELTQKPVATMEEPSFYANFGGHIYEIQAKWIDNGTGCQGTANYYVYVIGGSL